MHVIWKNKLRGQVAKYSVRQLEQHQTKINHDLLPYGPTPYGQCQRGMSKVRFNARLLDILEHATSGAEQPASTRAIEVGCRATCENTKSQLFWSVYAAEQMFLLRVVDASIKPEGNNDVQMAVGSGTLRAACG